MTKMNSPTTVISLARKVCPQNEVLKRALAYSVPISSQLQTLSHFVTIGFCDLLLFVTGFPIPNPLFKAAALLDSVTICDYLALVPW